MGGVTIDYAASKGGVINMTREMACWMAQYNIRVNCINPAIIQTPLLDKEIAKAKDKKSYIRQCVDVQPIGRIGRPEEVARAVLFLASDDSCWITGSTFTIDGGATCA